MPYPFKQIFAVDPNNLSMVAADAEVVIFAPGDESRTPLPITDPTGVPLDNPVTTNEHGFGPAFIAELPQVAWEGGELTGFMESYEGLRDEAMGAAVSAVSAMQAADLSAESAATAAATAAAQVTTELSGALTAVQQAAADAAAAANLVGAPADTAIAAAIQGEDTETAAALDTTAASLVGKPASQIAQAVANSIAAKVKDELVVSVKDKAFGAKGDGVADDRPAIQAAIDYVYSLGGGQVYLPDGAYLVTASTSTETFSNDGVAVAANTGALILRRGVSLIGNGRARCKVFATNPATTIIYMIAAKGSTVAGMEIANAYVKGGPGTGNGIFTLSASTASIDDTLDCIFYGLYIHDVASYGIALQAGNPNNVTIDAVTVENTGADALDLKARNSVSHTPTGNQCTNIVVRNHGQRITGSNGVDVRGVWHLSNITVTDFGGNAALTYGGIRFRTKPDGTDPNAVEASKSTLNGFYVAAKAGAASAGIHGVESGSDYVHIANGVVENCTLGVALLGNATGSALRNTIADVTAINSTSYGFRAVAGVANAIFTGCTSVGSTTAGFRNEADHTTLIGCQSIGETVGLSTSVGATSSELKQGNRFTTEYGIATHSAATGRVNIDAKGASADIDIQFGPKGNGYVRFGNWQATTDRAITGYFPMRSAAGAVINVATVTVP